MEVRQYPEFTLARVRGTDAGKNSDNQLFRALADYTFGKNPRNQKISMTSPVAQTMEAGRAQDMAFFLPKSLLAPPEPNNSEVRLVNGEMIVAVIRYRGGWGSRRFEAAKEKLEEVLRNQADWQIAGKVIRARYNSPFSIPAFRSNEVLIPVVKY